MGLYNFDLILKPLIMAKQKVITITVNINKLIDDAKPKTAVWELEHPDLQKVLNDGFVVKDTIHSTIPPFHIVTYILEDSKSH